MDRKQQTRGTLPPRPPSITPGEAAERVKRGERCPSCGGRLYVRTDTDRGRDLSDLACLLCGREAAQIGLPWLPRLSLAPERPGAGYSGPKPRPTRVCVQCGRPRPLVDFDGQTDRCRRCWGKERS